MLHVLDKNRTFLRSLGKNVKGRAEGEFDRPTSVVVDFNGNFAVLDYGNNRVQIFDSQEKFKWTAGGFGSGDGQMKNPEAVAYDNDGNLYASDCLNHRIQVWSPSGVWLRKWGVNGSAPGMLHLPIGLAVGPDGNVVICDNGKPSPSLTAFLLTSTPSSGLLVPCSLPPFLPSASC